MRGARLGYALPLLAAVLWGVNAGVSRIPLRSGTELETFTSLRITGAFLVFVLVALVVDRSALRPPRGRELGLLAALGLVGVVGMQWAYNASIDRLPLGIALLIEYTAPVLVVLWARVIRREHIRAIMWPALALSLVGLAVVARVWDGLAFDTLGLVLAGITALCFTAYFLLGEHGVGDASPLRVILWSFGIAAVAMNVVGPVWDADALGVDASLLGRLSEHSLPAWVAMTWTVTLGTVVPFFVMLVALRVMSATVASVIAMLEPVVASVVGWAWFSESLTPVQIGGMAMVLAGVVLAQTARRAKVPLQPTG